jgi:putative transposase
MQLIASRAAQEYNHCKARQGAFWQDRYHATAVDTDTYLARCIAYVDLNMVRADVVRDPRDWPAGGYREIQSPPKRYAIVDRSALRALLGFRRDARFMAAHAHWIDEVLQADAHARDPSWSQSPAVCRARLCRGRSRRAVEATGDAHVLRKPEVPYTAFLRAKTGL